MPDGSSHALRRGATVAGMVVGQAPFLAAAYYAPTTAGMLLFFALAPLPALLLALIELRPTQSPPDGPVEDWGVRFGRPWIQVDGRVYWVSSRVQHERITDAVPIGVGAHHSGFSVYVYPPHSGFPLAFRTLVSAWGALVGPVVAVVFAASAFNSSPDPTALLWRLGFATIVPLFCYGIVLAPWAVLFFAIEARMANRPITSVTLKGLRVEANRGSFLLGQTGQKIRRTDGKLLLTSDAEALTIDGQAPTLAFLERAFQEASSGSGQRSAVPASLHALKAAP